MAKPVRVGLLVGEMGGAGIGVHQVFVEDFRLSMLALLVLIPSFSASRVMLRLNSAIWTFVRKG